MYVRRDRGIYKLTITAAAAAVLCVLGPWAVPVGPVPVSLGTLLVYLTAYLLGAKRGACAVAVYLLMGAAGLPVFSGFAGGLGVLAGPTGGYLVGYLPACVLCGLALRRWPRSRWGQLAGMAAATAALYALGTAWYCLQAGTGLAGALAVCVLPFLPGDAAKLLAALTLGPVLRRRLDRAGL